MLNFNDVLSYYPKRLQVFKENILKEYLQHKILDIIFSTGFGEKLVFMGGTAIRIIHNSVRFSEDLDFDNLAISATDFNQLSRVIKRQLELNGYTIEMKNVFKNAFHCHIKFPGVLYQNKLSGYKEERILIRLDTEPQKYNYLPDKCLLNKFGFFRYINAAPIQLLLSQKIVAALNRKRAKGRDFFDVIYLMSKTQPDFEFLSIKLKINSKRELKNIFKTKIKDMNFKLLAKDVEPFLFDPTQKIAVLDFPAWLETL